MSKMASALAWSRTRPLLALLLLLLVHPSVSALPSHPRALSTLSSPSPLSSLTSPTRASASASVCLNDCSGHGSCSPASTCLCDAGYLGVDCHVASLMEPLCVPSSSAFLSSTSLSASPSTSSPLCLYWRIVDSVYYQRVVAVNNPTPFDPSNATNVGWAGVLWDNDPSQGSMAGGKLVLLTTPSPYTGRVQDLYAATDDTPSLTADQTVSPYNVTGHSTATTIDVSFQRLCNTSTPLHFAFSAQPGTRTNLGVAWLATPLAFHDTNAYTFGALDIAATATQSACVANCSGNGECVRGTCRCAVGYLGSSCAVNSAMAPLCFNGGAFCTYWSIVGASLYLRITALANPKATTSAPAAGYSAIMWGATSDGMTNGTGHRLYWNATLGKAVVTDIYATRKGRPSDAVVQTASDVSGWASNSTIDISFQRPLQAVDAQHLTLAAAPGEMVPLSVALGESNFGHHNWAQLTSVDVAETAAGGPQCLNGCSQRGSCSSLGFCQCNAGYLGADCSVQSFMAPLCFNAGTYCAYWRIIDSQLHLRVVAVTNPKATTSAPAAGYCAIMWGAASNGMTNGTGHRMSWSGNYTVGRPLVTDIYATRQGPPSIAAVQTATDVTGFATNTTVDVSFNRPLQAVDAQHFSINPNDGYSAPLSVALGEVSFAHHTWAQLSSVDMALSAAGGRCVNDCSGHGVCTSAASCQCEAGYLAEDCSLLSFMQPLCYQLSRNTTLCMYWRFASSSLFMRIIAQTSPNGWAAVMWGAASNGMTGGLGHRISVTPTGVPQVVDIAATARSTPSIAAAQVATSIAGYSTPNLIDVSFRRPTIGVDAQHFNLTEQVTGVLIPFSVAVGSAVSARHFYANLSSIDMAAAARGSGCVGDCSGHGQCQAATSTCMCEQHFLGADCSLPASHTLCPQSGFCMDWSVVQTTLFMRVRAAVSANGWLGLMWGADSKGMAGGKGLVLSLSQAQADATEISSSGFTTPPSQPWDYIGRNLSGYSADGYIDFSFARPCLVPQQPTALQLPTVANELVTLSWAMKDGAWPTPHDRSGDGSGVLQVDMITGDANVVQRTSLIQLYLPILLGAALIVVAALFLRIPAMAWSAVGRCCLRKRLSSLSADAYALTVAHQREKSPLTSDSVDSALIIQSDDSITVTTHVKALLGHLDRFSLNAVTSVYHLTVGELLVLLLYTASMVSFALAAVSSLSWARMLGHLTAVHLTLTVLPVSRSSVWHSVFGISFERAIKWHRLVARATAALVLLHGLLIVRLDGVSVLFSTAALPHGMGAVYGSLAAACIFLMAVTAISLIRRGLFELFYYVHLPLFASTMAFASLHSVYARYYLIAPLACIALDWTIRLVHRCRKVQLVDASVLHNEEEGRWRVAKLTLRARMIPKPGQYVFINFPSLSLLQWHPFSVSSLPEVSDVNESTFTLHLLDMGQGTFTSAVCDAVAASEFSGGSPLSVSLDGPYGSLTIPFSLYPTLLLVAGGIGITPLASILYSLLASSLDSRVFLVWCARHAASFHLLFPDLISRMQRDPRMSVELFDTASRASSRAGLIIGVGTEELLRNDSMSEEKDAVDGGAVRGWEGGDAVSGGGGVEVRKGRPCLPRVFEMVAGEHQQREAKRGLKRLHPSMQGAAGVGVLCCGPTALLDEVEKESMRFGFHLHKETFLL